jgi:hypothetical protein
MTFKDFEGFSEGRLQEGQKKEWVSKTKTAVLWHSLLAE